MYNLRDNLVDDVPTTKKDLTLLVLGIDIDIDI